MNKKNAAIDLLKFLFALMIVLFHGGKNLPEQAGYFINGLLGVEFFFIVSGYLMAVSARRYADPHSSGVTIWHSTRQFVAHKIARLSPDVFIAWFVSFAVLAAAKRYSLTTIVIKFLSGIFELLLLKRAGFTGLIANGTTWYLSAMLLAMAVLFPLLVAKRDFFLVWFAPLASVFLYGFMSSAWSNGLASSAGWTGFATKGMLRALGGICLGVTCYTAAQRLSSLRLRGFARLLATLLAVCCYLFVALYAFGHRNSSFDFVLVLLLACGVTVTFSGIDYSALLSASAPVQRVCGFLGEFSMDLFLSHGYWSNQLDVFLPGWTGSRLLLVYLAVSFTNALLLMLVSRFLRGRWPGIRSWLRRACLKESGTTSP